MTLAEYLSAREPCYDAAERLLREPATGPGYHTQVARGTPAHSTRNAMDYALALLQSGDAALADRASDIIDRIVELQVTDPVDQHYGIWGWFMEEPPAQMNPADWNWADFIGVRLAQALAVHGQQLRSDTAAGVRRALHHAAMAIFRRNCGPGYTNIAIMGGVATAAAGELLSLPFLTEYAIARLNAVIRLHDTVGGFTEYNSPAYTRVGIEETERALLIVRNPEVRRLADRIRCLEWQAVAEHYHPGTGQIAGPCSRAYSDWLTPVLCRDIREATGAVVPSRYAELPLAQRSAQEGYCIVPAIACPDDLRPRFSGLPEDPHAVTSRFGSNRYGDIVGTTWFSRDACLGSVNRDMCWHQRRSLLGYWRTDQDPAVCLRVRGLRDDQDFCGLYLHMSQHGPRILASVGLAYGVGDFHPIFDRSPDDTFPVRDLRLRLSLAGRGVRAVTLGDSRYALRAGDWHAVVCTPHVPCVMGGRPIQWELLEGSEEVHLDAVLHHGGDLRLDCRNTLMQLAFGLELAPASASPCTEPPTLAAAAPYRIGWTWAGLSVDAPERPIEFCW